MSSTIASKVAGPSRSRRTRLLLDTSAAAMRQRPRANEGPGGGATGAPSTRLSAPRRAGGARCECMTSDNLLLGSLAGACIRGTARTALWSGSRGHPPLDEGIELLQLEGFGE